MRSVVICAHFSSFVFEIFSLAIILFLIWRNMFLYILTNEAMYSKFLS